MKHPYNLNNPKFSIIIFKIETLIHKHDGQLQSEGTILTDTHVRSCLQKALGFAKGKTPSLPDANAREKGMKLISQSLVDLGRRFMSGEESDRITSGEWIFSLKSVEESLKTRKAMHGHSRGYLDFLKGFLKEAGES